MPQEQVLLRFDDAAADPQIDVFISYATDDLDRAKAIAATLRAKNLSVFIDVPTAANLTPIQRFARSLTRRWQEPAVPEDQRYTDDVIQKMLETWLANAKSVLVLWSRSHRGSAWSGEEIDIFESDYGTRPIFCFALDETPIAALSDQWTLLSNIDELTGDKVGRLRKPAKAPKASRVGAFDTFRRPREWIHVAKRLRTGTSIPELFGTPAHLLRDSDRAAERNGLVRSAGLSLALLYAATLLLAVAVCVLAWKAPDDRLLVRHTAFVLSFVWAVVPLLALQASVPSVLRAAAIALPVGLMTQLVVVFASSNTRGGPAVGAAMGAMIGGVLASSLSFDNPRHRDRVARLRNTTVGTAAGMAIAIATSTCVTISLAPQRGSLRDGLLMIIVPTLLLLPALAMWHEVGNLGRARELVRRGRAPALAVLVTAAAIAVALAKSSVTLNHQRVPGALVGGLLTAICIGAAYLAPGSILGLRVPPIARAVGSTVATTGTLLSLYLVFRYFRPGDDFIPDLEQGILTYLLGFLVAILANGAMHWRRARHDALQSSASPLV